MNRLYDPTGKPYNIEDPLDIISKEKEEKFKENNPSKIQQFIESEAKKKDESRRFRLERPSKQELIQDFTDILYKLNKMVVIFRCKKRGAYICGRVDFVGDGFVRVFQRGNKKVHYVDFDEVLSLKANYN